jgi:hypothetical protein
MISGLFTTVIIGMELNREVAHYVVRFHHQFMTDVERRTQRHLFATMKATMGRSDVAAQREAAQKSRIHYKSLSDDPNVLCLAADGYESFELQTAARILQEHRAEIRFNRCPRCSELARTPTAKQCRFCGHDWHETA